MKRSSPYLMSRTLLQPFNCNVQLYIFPTAQRLDGPCQRFKLPLVILRERQDMCWEMSKKPTAVRSP